RAIRLPEVQHRDLAAQGRQAHVPRGVDARAREARRGDDLALVGLPRGVAGVVVGELPDQQPEQRAHERDRPDLRELPHQMMNTVVPTETWSNSHSASGMYMRMQPCERL